MERFRIGAPHISLAQRNGDRGRRPGVEDHFFESSEDLLGFSGSGWEGEVELRLLHTREGTSVGDGERNNVAGPGLANRQARVGEGGIRQSKTEFKSGADVLAIHVAIVEKELLRILNL